MLLKLLSDPTAQKRWSHRPSATLGPDLLSDLIKSGSLGTYSQPQFLLMLPEAQLLALPPATCGTLEQYIMGQEPFWILATQTIKVIAPVF